MKTMGFLIAAAFLGSRQNSHMEFETSPEKNEQNQQIATIMGIM